MRKYRLLRLLAVLMALGLVAAACGDDDDDGVDTETNDAPATTEAPAETTEGAAETTAAPSDTTEGGEGEAAGEAFDLASVCPDPIVVQTDWFPESEHGALYHLVGEDYTVDGEAQVTRGSLIASGDVDTGVDIEVRAGGPAIGFAPVASHMYTDSSITLGYQSTDAQVFGFNDTPTIAVVAPLEINPQIILWDPDTYPEVETIADLGEEGVTIFVFGGGSFIEVFVNEGIVSADQVDPSYDGSPATFIASGGTVAHQGFASAEPYNYEHVFEEWGKPIAYQLIHDAGLQIYSQPLGIRAGDLEELRPCLEKFVPIVQQAVVDFAASPDRANAIIIDAVATIDSFWVYDEGIAQFSVDTQKELGLVGNGPDDTVGNMELERVQTVIDKMVAAGMEVPEGLTADMIVSNEFIDESIGFSG